MTSELAHKRDRLALFASVIPLKSDESISWRKLMCWYSVAFGYQLALGNAMFWDDWRFYSDGPVATGSRLNDCAPTICRLPGRAEIESVLIAPGPWLIHVLVFFVAPSTTYLLHAYLRRLNWLTKFELSVFSIAFLMLPVYGARVALINFQYQLSLLWFVIGALMTLSAKPVFRWLSLLPLFWSMYTASLQVFAIALAITLVISTNQRGRFRSTVSLAIAIILLAPAHRYLLPAVLPEVFPPYTGDDPRHPVYNQILPSFLIRAVLYSLILIFPLVVVVMRTRMRIAVGRKTSILAIGLALLALGTFPYIAVGHFVSISDWVLPFLPDESDWNSRHQLLQPFGLSLIVVSLTLAGQHLKSKLLLGFLAICVALNLGAYSGYYLDSVKQREIMNVIPTVITSNTSSQVIIIDDQAPRFNARGRGIRDGEWVERFQKSLGRYVRVDNKFIPACTQRDTMSLLTITAENGRLKALLTRRVGIVATLEPLGTCS